MIKIYLVRHGEAIDGWTSQDPPLSELGKSQAEIFGNICELYY